MEGEEDEDVSPPNHLLCVCGRHTLRPFSWLFFLPRRSDRNLSGLLLFDNYSQPPFQYLLPRECPQCFAEISATTPHAILLLDIF